MENTMNRTIATAIFAFTAMFAADNATAQDFFKPGVTAATITNKTIASDPTIHMLFLKSVEPNGDYVMEIQKSENSKEWLGVDGNKVVWGAKAEKWVLHKNSSGWSVILKSNAAMTVGLNKSKDGLELQRNQGYPHQVWDIKMPTASTSKMFVPGTFEQPVIAKGKFELVEKLPGWKTSDSVFEIWSSGFLGVEAHEGNQFVELNANIDGTLYRESSGIVKGATIEFTFAHRGRNGADSMQLTMTDLGTDNAIGGGDDTQLFVKQYTTGKSAWNVYDSTSEPQISALGNTVRFAYTAVDSTDGKGAKKSEGNFLDAAHFGVNVVAEMCSANVPHLGTGIVFGAGKSGEAPFGKITPDVGDEVITYSLTSENDSLKDLGVLKGQTLNVMAIMDKKEPQAMISWKTSDPKFKDILISKLSKISAIGRQGFVIQRGDTVTIQAQPSEDGGTDITFSYFRDGKSTGVTSFIVK